MGLGVYCLCSEGDTLFGGCRDGDIVSWHVGHEGRRDYLGVERAAEYGIHEGQLAMSLSPCQPAGPAVTSILQRPPLRTRSPVMALAVNIAACKEYVAVSLSTAQVLVYLRMNGGTLQQCALLVSPDEHVGSVAFTDEGSLLQQGRRLYLWTPQHGQGLPVIVARTPKSSYIDNSS